MPSEFFAMLSRMKYIDRWGLMRNTRQENLSEHSFETAVLAHALATLRNVRFGGHVNPERAAVLALFHDAPETLTGDLPTPVKYYSADIRGAYRAVESAAEQTLLSLLPSDLQDIYAPLLRGDSETDAELHRLVKAADKLSALIKCLEERRMGNAEFLKAEDSLWESIRDMQIPEADCFWKNFFPLICSPWTKPAPTNHLTRAGAIPSYKASSAWAFFCGILSAVYHEENDRFSSKTGF